MAKRVKQEGYVYVLHSKTTPGLRKIGKAKNVPGRARTLNKEHVYAVRRPYRIECAICVPFYDYAEVLVHTALQDEHFCNEVFKVSSQRAEFVLHCAAGYIAARGRRWSKEPATTRGFEKNVSTFVDDAEPFIVNVSEGPIARYNDWAIENDPGGPVRDFLFRRFSGTGIHRLKRYKERMHAKIYERRIDEVCDWIAWWEESGRVSERRRAAYARDVAREFLEAHEIEEFVDDALAHFERHVSDPEGHLRK